MSLLQKAKVITTPTAYSDGFVHSVKPEIVLGEELVTNGTFDTDSNWIKGTGWTISGGAANCNGTTSNLITNVPITPAIGKQGKLKFEITNYVSGQIAVSLSGTGGGDTGFFTPVNGFYEFDLFGPMQPTSTSITVFSSSFIGSIDNISLKEKLDADFDFSRGSSATRVNELGYIEDVQTIGGELVTNGDFEEVGSEGIVNGDFSDGSTNWSMQSSWSIANGSANYNGTSSHYIEQLNVFTANTNYKITFTISNNTSGIISIRDGVGVILVPNTNYTNETHTFYIKSNTDTRLRIYGVGGSGSLSIDNVSVKEVGQDWTFINEAEFTDSGARIYSSVGSVSGINQSGILNTSNKYRIQYEIISNTNGSLKIQGVEIPSSVGIHSYDFIASSTALEILRNSGVTDITIDNISVKEITDDTDLPRINYEGFTYENGLPVPYSGVGSWLFEPQRTNEVVQSENFTATYWTYLYVNDTNNAALSPDGENNGTKIVADTTNTTHWVERRIWGGTASTTYTYSCFVKSAGSDYVQIATSTGFGAGYQNFNLSNGTLAGNNLSSFGYSANIEDYGNGWYRISVTAINNSSGDARFLLVPILTDTTRNPSFAGNGTDGVYTWGHQLEQSEYETSYIPTLNGTTVTRLADVCNNAGNSDLFDSTEGVLYAEIAALADDLTDRTIALSDGTTSNTVRIQYLTISNAIWATVTNIGAGGNQAILKYTSPNITINSKIAVKYKVNDFALWIDGVEVDTDSSGVTFPANTLNTFQFDRGNGAENFYGKIKMVAVFPYLSNDELECLTGEGYGTFEALAAAYSYTIS